MELGRETELIARARSGDRSALSDLLDGYHARLVRMVKLRLSARVRHRIDPADVVQDAWIEVVRRFDEWCAHEHVPFRVWVRLTTRQALGKAERHHLATDMRAPGREEHAFLGRTNVSAISMADAFVASATSPTQGAQRAELRTRVLAALEALDEIDREIVALRHYEGLSNEDAALELAIEPAAASKRFMRALLRLRPHLESLVDESAGT